MWETIWSGFRGGRIGRGPYFLYNLVIFGIVFGTFLFMVLGAVAITPEGGAGEAAGAGGALIFILVLIVLAIFATVAGLSLAAARGRDIGWDPWLAGILFFLFGGIMWIVLSLIPPKEDRTDL